MESSLALDVQLLKLLVTNVKFQRKPNQILLIEKMCWQLARGLTFRLMQILGGEAVPTQQRQRDLSVLVGIRRWAWWFKGENKTDTGTEGRGIQAHPDQISCQQ